MKKLIFGTIALVFFSAAGFAQNSTATKKAEPAKTQVAKKDVAKKSDAKVVNASKAEKKPSVQTATKAPVTNTGNTKVVPVKNEKKAVEGTSKTTISPVKPAPTSSAVLKKDGTPDKRYKANSGTSKGPLKKDGTPDKRFNANKKKN